MRRILGSFQKHQKLDVFRPLANKIARGALPKHQKLDVFDPPLICVAFGTLPKHRKLSVLFNPSLIKSHVGPFQNIKT